MEIQLKNPQYLLNNAPELLKKTLDAKIEQRIRVDDVIIINNK